MLQKITKHRANDASNDVHRPPLSRGSFAKGRPILMINCKAPVVPYDHLQNPAHPDGHGRDCTGFLATTTWRRLAVPGRCTAAQLCGVEAAG